MPETTKRSVFVVDDEPSIAMTVTLILNASGFSAMSFTNPLDALEAATSEIPDLLVSDVHMPQMYGIELAVQMMAKNPKCKVLLFSGQASTASLLEKARSEGKEFTLLAKPIHPPDLLREIGLKLS